MKKILVLLISLFLLSGCSFNSKKLENATIYTTVYPVKYITEYLYGTDGTIESIYPSDANFEEYSLTEKQIEEYSKGDLFVYMGVGNEKEIAKTFLNKNNKLLIIDATYGLNYKNSIEELWLAPNNFLMLVKNIKSSLDEYIDNTVKKDDIKSKYDELYEKVSWLDAELRSIGKNAKKNEDNTLIVATNKFKFLETYNFNVISIEDIEKSQNETSISELKNKFKTSKYSKILNLKDDKTSDLVNELTSKYGAALVNYDSIKSTTDTASDYVSMQYENIATIRNYLEK